MKHPETSADTAEQDQTDPSITFADLGLAAPLLNALTDVGYETPSAIQAQTIPALLAGQDMVGQAQTGTGKTAAFALPMLQHLDRDQRTPQGLVLTPTRELALQVCESYERYAQQMRWVKVLPVYGGQSYGVQLSALKRGVQVVVGTPGRIMDHLKRGTLNLSQLRMLVLDEADEMLNMGFVEDVETILAQTPDEKQVALFSATMPRAIRRLAQRYLHDPVEITVKQATTTATNVAQSYSVVSYAQKLDALTRVLDVADFQAVIVFVRTRHETETVAEKLRARGMAAAAINGDVAQAQRERTVQQLKAGKVDVLVATDVAARGLDVERISHVINYDIPGDPESYVHRIGRTGRAGRSGEAMSFVTPRERSMIKHIEKVTGKTIPQQPLPSVADVNATRLSRFDDAISEALSRDDEMEQFREVIAHYVRHHNVPEADVAAALAVVSQGDTPLLLDPQVDPLVREPKKSRRERDRDEERDRGREERWDRDRDAGRDRGRRPERKESRFEKRAKQGGFTTYRLEVGRRQLVEPRQIVGALANEGGLHHSDFGAIEIRTDFSLVELPAQLPPDSLTKLARTRISGQLIDIKPDEGPRPRRQQGTRPRRGTQPRVGGKMRNTRPDSKGKRGKKPRHKKKY